MDQIIFNNDEIIFDNDELILQPCVPNKKQQILQEMFEKYGLGIEFITQYLDYAMNRKPNDVLYDKLLLPPNTMDREDIKRSATECIQYLDFYSKHVISMRQEIREEVKKENSEKVREMTDLYCVMVEKAWRARNTLWKLSQMKPIDSKKFHMDISNYARILMTENFKEHFPMIAMDPALL